ncbi:hypothetical protein lerEdw1_013202 [Lerista edwardsae]|nr:hypothetical protein lerEdw1_013202 [Lerista edwardsae]
MRRASRDYSKYLRGAEELGSSTGHECAPPPAPLQAQGGAPAQPHSPPASRLLLAALVFLGLGQVICSVALFLYFRTQDIVVVDVLSVELLSITKVEFGFLALIVE